MSAARPRPLLSPLTPARAPPPAEPPPRPLSSESRAHGFQSDPRPDAARTRTRTRDPLSQLPQPAGPEVGPWRCRGRGRGGGAGRGVGGAGGEERGGGADPLRLAKCPRCG